MLHSVQQARRIARAIPGLTTHVSRASSRTSVMSVMAAERMTSRSTHQATVTSTTSTVLFVPACHVIPRAFRISPRPLADAIRRTADSTVPCVFRVDLEDHGEPGGRFPKGGSPPPDRYRMRMWFIHGLSPDSASVKALRDAVACHNPLDERVETMLPCAQKLQGSSAVPAPDIDDGGDLDHGNQQIHRNTAAPCAR